MPNAIPSVLIDGALTVECVGRIDPTHRVRVHPVASFDPNERREGRAFDHECANPAFHPHDRVPHACDLQQGIDADALYIACIARWDRAAGSTVRRRRNFLRLINWITDLGKQVVHGGQRVFRHRRNDLGSLNRCADVVNEKNQHADAGECQDDGE